MTNSDTCSTGMNSITLAPYDNKLSGTASNILVAIESRQAKPIWSLSEERSTFQFQNAPITCNTDLSLNNACPAGSDCFLSQVALKTAKGCGTTVDVSKKQDEILVGFHERFQGLLLNVYKGHVKDTVTNPKRTSTEWSKLSQNSYGDCIEIDATPESTSTDDGFVTLGSTLSSCSIGNDMSNNLHLTLLSLQQCTHTTKEMTCATIKVDRNSPYTYSYTSIGVGYCPKFVYLKGQVNYPPLLLTTDSKYSIDRKLECMFRCIEQDPKIIAFYLRDDNRCSCSKVGENCALPTVSTARDYSSYTIIKAHGTMPVMPTTLSSQLSTVVPDTWVDLFTSSSSSSSNIYGVELSNVPMSFYSKTVVKTKPMFKTLISGLFLATVKSSDTKGRISTQNILLHSERSTIKNEEKTSSEHAILNAGFVSDSLGFTAKITIPSDFNATSSAPSSTLTIMQWRGLFVWMTFTDFVTFTIGTTSENLAAAATVGNFATEQFNGISWTNEKLKSSAVAGKTLNIAFTTTNEEAKIYIDGVLYLEYIWPSEVHPITSAIWGRPPVLGLYYHGYPTHFIVSSNSFYNFWLTKESIALKLGNAIPLHQNEIVCNNIEKTTTTQWKEETLPWKTNGDIANAAGSYYKYICKTPSDYNGGKLQDFNSIQTTCDYEINYHVNSGYLKGEDFTKSGWKCSELGAAEKWIVEELGKSGCCGKTGTVCEEGGKAYKNSTLNIPSPDPSFICANPADYDGSHEFDSNGGATMTCNAMMGWVAAKGQVLYDFSQTKVCDDNAITYLGNMVTVGCCGPGKQHACDGSNSGNSNTARGASGGTRKSNITAKGGAAEGSSSVGKRNSLCCWGLWLLGCFMIYVVVLESEL